MRKKNSFLLPKSPVLSAFSGKMQEPDSSAANRRPEKGPIPGISPKEKHTRRSRFPGQTPQKRGNCPRPALLPRKARPAENTGGRTVPPVAVRRPAFVREVFRRKIPEIVFYCINIHSNCSAPAFRLFPGRTKSGAFRPRRFLIGSLPYRHEGARRYLQAKQSCPG